MVVVKDFWAGGVLGAMKRLKRQCVSDTKEFVAGRRELPEVDIFNTLQLLRLEEYTLRRDVFSKAIGALPEGTTTRLRDDIEARLKHMADEFAMPNYQNFPQKWLLIDGVSKDDLTFLIDIDFKLTKESVLLAHRFFRQLHTAYTDNKKGESDTTLILKTLDSLWYLPEYREQLKECYEQNFLTLGRLAVKVMGVVC